MADLSLVFDLLARDRASSEVDKVGDSMKEAGDQADGFGDRVSGMMAGLAGAAAGAGLAVGAAFAGMLESEAASRLTAAQLGLDPAQQAAAGKAAGAIYAGNYGESLEEVNTAIGGVMSSIDGMTDASSEATQRATQDALNFASAFGVDVTEAAQSAGILMRNGLAADADEAFDLMVAGMQQVPAALRGDVLPALDEYGQNFTALGYTGEQAMALLVDAGQAGPVVFDKMGDALGEFTRLVGADLAATGPVLKQLGLDAGGIATAIAAGGPNAQAAMQQVAQALQSVEDPAKRAETAVALFGSPLEDMGVDKIPQFLDAVQMANGELEGIGSAAEDLDATLASGLGPRLEMLKRDAQQAATEGMSALLAGFTQGATDAGGWQGSLQNLAATLSATFGPALDTVGAILTDEVGPALSSVFGYLAEHETTAQAIAGTISGVLALAFTVWASRATAAAATNAVAWISAAVSARTGAATTQLSALQVVASWVIMGARAVAQGAIIAGVWTAQIIASAIRGAITMGVQAAIVVGAWALMGLQALLRAGQMAAAWFIALGPIGWVIAAVAGIVALVIANWDKVKEFTGRAWSAVSTAVSNGVDRAVDFVKGLPGKALAALGNLGSWLTGAGSDLIDGLTGGIKKAAGRVAEAAKDAARAAVNGVKNLLGIASPSRVFADLGQWTMAGFAAGIDDGTGATLDAVQSAMSAVSAVGADLTADVGVAGGGLGYRSPTYDLPGGAGGASVGSSRTVHVTGVVGPEEVAAIVRREQATDEFLAGVGS